MPDVRIYQKPTYVTMECERCYHEISFSYKDFIAEYGEICDALYEKIVCPSCGHTNDIEEVIWD